MGNSNSTAPTRKKQATTSGFMGRNRMTKDYKVIILVNKITGITLGRERLRRYGNEGQFPYLSETDKTGVKFLQAAISFVPDAEDDGTDMKNACFILQQPGREYVIKAGDGDWQYYFSEDSDGTIYGRCVRKPLLRFVWDGVKSVVRRVVDFGKGFIPGLVWNTRKALTN